MDRRGATDPASVSREAWSSWERYTGRRSGSFESPALIDGLISYLATAVRDRASATRSDIARHPVRRHELNNQPILTSGAPE